MKTVYVALIFSLVLLVSGCVDYLPSIGGGTDNVGVVGFVGGDNGVVVSFVGNNPPARVFQNNNFNVVLQLENKGENDIDAGDIRVLISNMQNFGLEDNIVKYNENLIPKRIKTEAGFIPGGIDYISFDDVAYSGPAMITEDSPISIAVDVCYPYKTTAVADICITRERDETVCDPFGKPSVQTSSSPILITGITQMSNGLIRTDSDDVLLDIRIDFEMVGDGEIYNSDSTCSELVIDDINVITIDQITLGADIYNNDNVTKLCGYNDNKIGLDEDGNGFVICSIMVPNVPFDFEDRFTITTSYMHTQLLTQKIAVMPVLESMRTCTISTDCEVNEYCEQPGFCRAKIATKQTCGLPVELLTGENSDVSCMSGFCGSGYCTGIADNSEVYRSLICEEGLVIVEYDFEKDPGHNNLEYYGWTPYLTEDTTFIGSYCSGESEWVMSADLGYQSGHGLYTIAKLNDSEINYCVNSEKILVPKDANLKVSFMSNFQLDGGSEDSVSVLCATSDNYKHLGKFPGIIGEGDNTKRSSVWPGNEDGWVKFEYDIPEECIVNDRTELLFSAEIDSENLNDPVAIDDIKVQVDSCN
ncbi:hypothetical protein HN924_01395 [Candidatus Woesearchaeota archaeon]|jgi:hypothetical protein|nr:hypothetical protein [Candidatus Woesearchaeota archaeon]MBT7062603.1 hypothetical protein [Candidatus Woesearchaeota archaeon]MBT7402762.1 hypothetical protein [Candidatus Woesearchaeota archaeon]